jgi:hypothetical protein
MIENILNGRIKTKSNHYVKLANRIIEFKTQKGLSYEVF